MHERKNGRLGFSEKDKKNIWKNYMEKIIIKRMIDNNSNIIKRT